MTQSRKAPFDRLLTLVRSLSESTEGLTLDEMAAELRQGRRSAERARDLIALHFDLDEIVDGPRKRFRIRDSLRRHYTRPTALELATLKAEIESLRPGGGARFRELTSLIRKVQSSFDDREKHRIEPDLEQLIKYQRSFVGPGPRVQVNPETWRTVADAIMSSLCLECDYLAVDADEPRWRKLACAGLINGPVSYLIGFIPGADRPPAIYRLDRISDARLSSDPAQLPSGFDLDDWLAQSFGIWREDTHDIVLRVFAGSADRARAWQFHPRQVIEEIDDGDLLVRFRAGSLREIAEHLFQWAGELHIQGPDELKQEMRDRAELALSMTGDC